MIYHRYAIFFTPPPGPLAGFGVRWLGWDIRSGTAMAQPRLADLDLPSLTEKPRKYGFHATLKPPFFLADGTTEAQLLAAATTLCRELQPVTSAGLEVSRLCRFLALTPIGDASGLSALAAQVVRELDAFRAPPSPQEVARRKAATLTAAQAKNLEDWGYPHVMDAFRFHMTLTGRLAKPVLTKTLDAVVPMVAPVLPVPFVIDSLTLVGQRPDGMFEEISRMPLGENDARPSA